MRREPLVTALAGAPADALPIALPLPLPIALALALALSLAAGAAAAQSRWVFVNGQRLTDSEVARFDRLQCNAIPNGHYWLDERSGVWGYAGNAQPQGRVGDGCLNGLGRMGPFATQRRAYEVAGELRSRGVGAVVLHDGDGWYVQPQR